MMLSFGVVTARITRDLPSVKLQKKVYTTMENDILSFHRSWTGVCIYEVHFDNYHTIKEVWVNRDIDQYKETDNSYDEKLLTFLIDNLLLGQSTPFPVSNNIPNDLPRGLHQHVTSGTGYPEKHNQRKDKLITKVRRFFEKK